MNENLISVLERADNEDLKTLCDIITLGKNGTPRISDNLTKTSLYKHNYPNNMPTLVPGMVRELSLYGGNSVVNYFKGEGVDYSAILRKVAKRLKVNFRKTQPDEVIEGYMLQKLFDDMSENLSDEELRSMASEFGVKPLRYSRQALVAALQMSIRRGGIYGLAWSMNLANIVAKQAVGRGVAILASDTVLSRTLSILGGPIGWALTAAWTAYDIAGPAYRVIVPAVIYIAYLRRKNQQLALPIYCEVDEDEEAFDD
ncbi:MAG: DUF3944 domain-containing protein [Muribaculaceae bacterium]|nr:DUF3944 domain-containing protein [Muribaculaceae bacterium]